MSKYVCSICGFVYDEAQGIPSAGIAPGTKWDDLPDDWDCPLCGAPKSAFEKQSEAAEEVQKKPVTVVESASDMQEMNALQLSALCTNLARGCEKQYKPEEEALFKELAEYFKQSSAPAGDPSFDQLLELVEKDLAEGFPSANAVAADAKDRGAGRALTWSIKVTRLLKSLLTRYKKQGEAMIKNTGVYVCTICGFIYIGDALPDLCPVCKVPNWKFEEVVGR